MIVKLGDICSFQSGGTPSKSNANYFSGEIPWITTVALNGLSIGEKAAVDWITEKAIAESAAKIVPARSIMVGTRVGIGKVAINEIPMSTSQDIISLVEINESLWSKEYLCKFIQSKEKYLKSQARGATIKGIKIDVLASLAIPDVPLESQQKIVATLDKAQNILAAQRSQLSALDDLIKARFVEMFGDPFSNPLNWECISFKESSLRLSDGPFGSNLKSEHYSETGVRVIRLGNIGVGRFIDEDKSFIPPEHYEKLKKYTCHAGEIVIGTLGDPNLRACIIPKEIGIAVNKADCVHYIPDPSLLNTEFACQYVNCPETLLLAHGMIHGQTRSRVSSGQIAEMPIFIPPLELQNVFSDFVHQIDKSKSAIQKSLDKTQLLFDSLMQQYFG